jgi:diaminohydroxyphosphoribosylaminopyrimidine deaminase/5-amino-6-(5-phosphoribosylamino)uracil reductase
VNRDAAHLRRARALVAHATHRTSPNPLVGCVVVRDGKIVGEGVTQPPGQAHAEIMALRQAGGRARGADVYVTLEPCCHHGRTPPCTDALVAAGVRRVVAGVIDPNPMVAGRGLEQLRAGGVIAELATGPEAAACEATIAPFRRFILDGRPWVVLKAATSLDGRIAAPSGDARWITGEAARRDAHRLRAACDGVLVGGETVRRDDPHLTVRGVAGADPRRLVLSRSLDLPEGAAVLAPGTLVFHGAEASAARRARVIRQGAELVELAPAGDGLDVAAMLAHLGRLGMVRLLVEGGGRTHGALLAARLADAACFYVAPRLLGEGRPAIAGLAFDPVATGPVLTAVSTRRFGQDVRIQGVIRYCEPPCSPG